MKIIDAKKDISKPYFVLVYGASGTGKTHLCGTLGEIGNVLFIDIDQGYETISCADGLAKFRDNITVVSFENFRDLDTAYKAVKKNDPKHWSTIFNTEITSPFDWIVWDTWSEIQFYMVEELRSQKNHDRFTGVLGFRKGVELQHWGMLTDLNKLSIQELRKCPVNQIFIMQETLIKDELSGAILGGPAIHGKMVQEMPSYFGIVVHTETDLMGRYKASTKSKGKWPAKSRRGAGGDFINPTMRYVLGITEKEEF